MSTKPHLHTLYLPLGAMSVPSLAEAPAVGAALVRLLCFDVLLGRTATVGRKARNGRFQVSTSLAPLTSPFIGDLADAMTNATFSRLAQDEMVKAGIPIGPEQTSEAGALLIGLFELAQSYELPPRPASKFQPLGGREILFVDFDHRPHAEEHLRYRVVFTSGTNDSVRAASAIGALRLGLPELSARAARYGLPKLDPDHRRP